MSSNMSSARDKRWELRDRSFFSFGTSSFVWEMQQLTKKREAYPSEMGNALRV